MKINFIKKTLLLLTLSLAIASCDDDDFTGDSTVDYSKATVTLSSLSPTVIDESAIDSDDPNTYQIEVMATLAEPAPIDARIDLVQIGGNADGADFEGNTITIKAGYTSAIGTINILQTGDIEGNETLIIGGSSKANFNVAPFEHNVAINNDYINDVLDITVDWSGMHTYTAGLPAEVTIDFCDIDVDLLIYDSTFADTGLYDAATGSCPEHIGISGLTDGLYYLVANVYDNPFSGLGAGAAIPLKLTYFQEYFIDEAEIINQNLTSDTPTGSNILVATLEVVDGYTYTLTPQ